MPELPEVETVRSVLKPRLAGQTVAAVVVRNGSVIARPDADEFAGRIRGQVISDFTRRGKFLTIHFESGDSVVLHLRMTGCLTIDPPSAPYEKHTHVVFSLGNGSELRYEDTRRFGRFWLIENGTPDTFSGKERLGREPSGITSGYIKDKFGRSRRPLKELLLDQSIVAGIGNIYSDEICFAAQVLPSKAGSALTECELERLCREIPGQIAYFIEKNSVTFEEYARAKGRSYRNTPFLRVYGKKGMPCPVCGGTLDGMRIGSRSSVFCGTFQK